MASSAIRDVTGSEEHQSQRQEFMRWVGQGFLCVYTVDDIKSFVGVNVFPDQLRRVKDTDRIPLVLVANKRDTANCLVTPALGQEAARTFRVPFMETSATTGQSVEHAFHELVLEVGRSQVQQLKGLPNPEQNQGCRFRNCMIL